MNGDDPIATALAAAIVDAIAACDASNAPDLEHPWRYTDEEIANTRWRHIENDEARELVKSLHEAATGSRVKHLIDALEEAPTDLFWPVFLNTWPNCGGTWPYQPKLLDMLRHHADQERAINYMHPAAIEFFDALPPVVTAFRGCDRDRVLGLPWSISQGIAKQFADDHLHPVLATAKIGRRAIFAVSGDRLEFEIIVDPKYLRKLKLRAVKISSVD